MAITEGTHTLEFLLSEGNGQISRENVTLASGAAAAYPPGTVLGKVTASGKFVALDPEGEDGSETAAAILCAGADATSADVEAAVIVRDAEVASDRLVWPAGIDPADKAAAVAAFAGNNIHVR